MSDTSRAAFLQARKCWPDRGHEARIPAAAKQIYDSWMSAPSDERRIALDAAVASGLTRIQGRDNKRAQCRDLTLFGSPLPTTSAALHPLTLEHVEALGVGVVPPLDYWCSLETATGVIAPSLSFRAGVLTPTPPVSRAIAHNPTAQTIEEVAPPSSPDGGEFAGQAPRSRSVSLHERLPVPSQRRFSGLPSWNGCSRNKTSAFGSSSPNSSPNRTRTCRPRT
jgi:hypothetical protein